MNDLPPSKAISLRLWRMMPPALRQKHLDRAALARKKTAGSRRGLARY